MNRTIRRKLTQYIRKEMAKGKLACGRLVLGLDFGNGGVKCIVAEIRDDGVVDFSYLTFDGHYSIPSVISFPSLQEPLIGIEAQNSALIGRGSLFGIGKDGLDHPELVYAIGDDHREYTSTDTLRVFIGKVIPKLEEALGFPLRSLPLCVSYPADFPSQQRNLLLKTLRESGLEILEEGEEPVHATLSFVAEFPGPQPVILLMIDLGAGTSDVAVLVYEPGTRRLQVKSVLHIAVAGIDFDNRLVGLIQKKCFPGNSPVDPVLLSEMKMQAIGAKHELSDREDALVTLSFQDRGECWITRSEFEQECRELLQSIRQAVLQAVGESQLSVGAIDKMILTGGTGRIPAVQALLQSLFPQGELLMSDFCELDVALGNAIAGVQTAQQQNRIPGRVPALPFLAVQTVLSYDLCLQVLEGTLMNPRLKNHLLIARNTPIPTVKKMNEFRTAVSHQACAEIILTAAEPNSDFEEHQVVDQKFLILNPQSENRAPQVEVQAQVNEKGRAVIVARDLFGDGAVTIDTEVPTVPLQSK